MARVLILTHGTEGDARPMVQIGKALLGQGHSVILITNSIFEQLARGAGLEFTAIDTPAEYEQRLLHLPQTDTPQNQLRVAREYDIPTLPIKYARIQEHYRPGETILLAIGHNLTVAQIATEKLEMPVVAIYHGPALLAQVKLKTMLPPATKLDISRFRVQLGLPPEPGQPRDIVAIALWPDWYAPFKPEGASQILQAGFPPGGDPNEALPVEVEALLATGPAPIMLTGGSGVFASEVYYSASIEACRRLGRRVILVARRQAGLPRTLPADVHVFPTLPFGSLMPRVAAVIHHGGIGTIAHAFAAGVPQVLLANGIDRPDNAMRVERLGVGKFVPPRHWTADGVAAALMSVVDQPPVRTRCQELARRMHEGDCLARVADTIEKMAHHG